MLEPLPKGSDEKGLLEFLKGSGWVSLEFEKGSFACAVKGSFFFGAKCCCGCEVKGSDLAEKGSTGLEEKGSAGLEEKGSTGLEEKGSAGLEVKGSVALLDPKGPAA